MEFLERISKKNDDKSESTVLQEKNRIFSEGREYFEGEKIIMRKRRK
jgi:hypothetical protein